MLLLVWLTGVCTLGFVCGFAFLCVLTCVQRFCVFSVVHVVVCGLQSLHVVILRYGVDLL